MVGKEKVNQAVRARISGHELRDLGATRERIEICRGIERCGAEECQSGKDVGLNVTSPVEKILLALYTP